MVYSVVTYQRIHLVALALILRIIDSNRVAAEVLHKAHTRDIGSTVAYVNHTREWHGARFLLHIAVYELCVIYRLHAFVDLEDKLRLVGVVYRYSRPICDAVHIVEERAGVYLLEAVGNLRTLDNLLQAR